MQVEVTDDKNNVAVVVYLLTHFRMRCITTVSYVEANIDIGQKNGFPFSFLHLCLFHK